MSNLFYMRLKVVLSLIAVIFSMFAIHYLRQKSEHKKSTIDDIELVDDVSKDYKNLQIEYDSLLIENERLIELLVDCKNDFK